MKQIQRNVFDYVNQAYRQDVYCTLIGEDCIRVWNAQNNEVIATLTANLFGDIIDAKTEKIIAVSNIPHEIDYIIEHPSALPEKWQRLD